MDLEQLKEAVSEINELRELFGSQAIQVSSPETEKGLNSQIGEKVIIRTYSAGNWFGTLNQKSGNEVILANARRLWRWHAKEGISLSGVANYGIVDSDSRIEAPVCEIWLEAIEIISMTKEAIKTIESAEHAKPE